MALSPIYGCCFSVALSADVEASRASLNDERGAVVLLHVKATLVTTGPLVGR